MHTANQLRCGDTGCGAAFPLLRDESVNQGRRRARDDGWTYDRDDHCPATTHRASARPVRGLVPAHTPLFGTETR